MHFRPHTSILRPSITVVLATVALAALGPTLSCSGPGPSPDLIIITVDTLRADFVGVEGRATAETPNIDRLMRGGTSFVNAYTPMPRTTPGVASLLTGLWPQHHGSREVGEPVSSGATLAELLASRGYHTVGVSANISAGPRQGLDRGFAQFVDGDAIKQRYEGRLYRDGTDVPPNGIGWAEATTREALELVASAPADSPLFLWLLYFDPHALYRPPSPWQDRVEATECWELYDEYVHTNPHLMWKALIDFEGVASRAVKDCQALYDAEISFTDHEIGRLLDGLGQHGRSDNAIVVFTADHGENFGEGNSFFEHGDNAHNSAIRVPLAISGPGIAGNRIDRGSVSLVDVMPTLLARLAITDEELPTMDGSDLSARIAESGSPHGEDDPRAVFAESASALRNQAYETILTGRASQRACINGPRYTFCDVWGGRQHEPVLYDHVSDPGLSRDIAARHPDEVARLARARELWPPESARFRAAMTPRFKLVQSPRLEGGYSEALYDLLSDPAETVDVSSRHPELQRDLSARLDAWAADIPLASPPPVSPEVTEALRALGYIGDPYGIGSVTDAGSDN
jgi:arylsulfatase A-like enzyme